MIWCTYCSCEVDTMCIVVNMHAAWQDVRSNVCTIGSGDCSSTISWFASAETYVADTAPGFHPNPFSKIWVERLVKRVSSHCTRRHAGPLNVHMSACPRPWPFRFHGNMDDTTVYLDDLDPRFTAWTPDIRQDDMDGSERTQRNNLGAWQLPDATFDSRNEKRSD